MCRLRAGSSSTFGALEDARRLSLAVEKLVTYWRVRSMPDESIAPWEQLDTAPSSTAGLVGELKVENDDQIQMVYFVDEVAQERVTRGARDAAALAQEWEIPHRPARRDDSSP